MILLLLGVALALALALAILRACGHRSPADHDEDPNDLIAMDIATDCSLDGRFDSG